MNLTREERETIVRTSDADDGWIISTASPKYIRKFTKLGYQESPDSSGLKGYRDFTVPRNLVSFQRPPKSEATCSSVLRDAVYAIYTSSDTLGVVDPSSR